MDGLFHFSGIRRVPLKKHGKEYSLSVRQLADYGIKEQVIVSRLGSPYAGIDSLSNPDDRVKAMKIAAEISARPKIATFADEQRFDNSMIGLAYNLWRGLSVDHAAEFPPNVPHAVGVQLGMDFIEWYGKQDIGELISAVYEMQEDDTVKNSNGPTLETAQGQ